MLRTKLYWILNAFLFSFWIYLCVCLTTVLLFPRPIHVFFEDYATTPELLEIIKMVQLPKKDPKFFAFHRFPKRSDYIDLNSINAKELDIPSSEGMYSVAPNKFYTQLKPYLEKYKNHPIILYGNRDHFIKMYTPLLKEIDPKRIQHVYLFEDGWGNGGYQSSRDREFPTDEEIKSIYQKCLNEKCDEEWKANWGIHKILPVTYHIAFKDVIMSDSEPSFTGLQKLWKTADIKNISIPDIKKNLTSEDQELLIKILGFDPNILIKQAKGHKIGIVCTGFILNNNDNLFQKEVTAIKEILKNAPKDVVWFLKMHPSYGAREQNQKLLKEFPDLFSISPELPIEVVLLTVPVDFVTGYRSSAFFSIPSEKIYKVIGSQNESIIKGLLNMKQITPEKIQPIN